MLGDIKIEYMISLDGIDNSHYTTESFISRNEIANVDSAVDRHLNYLKKQILDVIKRDS